MRLVSAIALALVSASCLAAAPMKPGLWQITTDVTLPGSDAKIPPVVAQQCFTAAQLKQTEHPLPAMPGCTLADSKRDGDITRWRMQCDSEQGKMSAQGEIRYAPESYSGSASFTMQEDGKNLTMTHRYRAKRVGACK